MYLIAHKYCGEATFDVASQMLCPMCNGVGRDAPRVEHHDDIICDECDGEGHWWMLNDGHRAYPFWSKPLYQCAMEGFFSEVPNMPDDARDTYPAPKATKEPPAMRGHVLLAKLGLGRKVERRL